VRTAGFATRLYEPSSRPLAFEESIALVASWQFATAAPLQGRRTLFDCAGRTSVQSVALTEDGPSSKDDSVNRPFDGLGNTREFYESVDRNSLDGRACVSVVIPCGTNYENAFWNSS
jgi:Zn-dependent metalloprotease